MSALLTPQVLEQLRANGVRREEDHVPVVKVFSPTGAATWVFTEIDEDGDTLFGLADMGFGEPELGYVSLRELQSIRVPPLRLPLEVDLWMRTEAPLSVWTQKAREARRIVDCK